MGEEGRTAHGVCLLLWTGGLRRSRNPTNPHTAFGHLLPEGEGKRDNVRSKRARVPVLQAYMPTPGLRAFSTGSLASGRETALPVSAAL